MATTKTYEEERAGYYKILVGLLLLTAVTLIQPHYFLANATFGVQMLIGLVKAYLIVMYYMHLKGERLIISTVFFASFLVLFFFVIVMIDVNHFQFGDVSHITSEITSAGGTSASHH
ncbi:MAG: caa(3)-type oxidase subunit IV [Sulfurimonas sp.]|jgi:caa(3)-type oxidase subunit IV|uniref:cytochrome C oxidase subunit IV family protein n=1 Tax=Sulfurimonas sp. TaxID=2022749 RepID=UPI0039E5C2B8